MNSTERVRVWRHKNPDKVKAHRAKELESGYAKIWRIKNSEKKKLGQKKYKEKSGYDRGWYVTHIDWFKARDTRRRALEINADGHFSRREWFTLCFAVGFVCLRCKAMQKFENLSPDHVVALSQGGTNWLHNIQPMCLACNISKLDKYEEYRW
jgi:hypothetical protein